MAIGFASARALTNAAPAPRRPMLLYVSLVVEVLRGRPNMVFWSAVIAQAAVWSIIPAIFYPSPPGDLATVIAVGREFQLGTRFGPPLTFWAAEGAYHLLGLFGVYLLAQVCIVVAFWAVYRLGAAIAGRRQAVLAVLLMIGVSALTVATPEFGPGIGATPLWALSLLFYWRAAGERRAGNWYALAISAGLLLLTSAAGVVLLGLLAVFTVATPRGRQCLRTVDPWLAAIVTVVIIVPYAIWATAVSDTAWRVAQFPLPDGAAFGTLTWLRLIGLVLVAHAGLFVLVVLTAGWPFSRRQTTVAIDRPPVDPFARTFAYFFALAPAVVAATLAAALNRSALLGGIAPLVLLSGLAVVLLAGDRIHLHNQSVSAYTWFGLLIAPPVIAVLAILMLPWLFPIDLRIAQPANEMGRFFAETFEHRTGQQLTLVGGDRRLATLVALGVPGYPTVAFDHSPEREAIKNEGALVVWPALDAPGTPPPEIAARFPGLVPEVPRAFTRPVQGLLPFIRVGWGIIRPQAKDQ